MLRKIDSQRHHQPAVYEVPDTHHWASWRDADAVVYHGTLVARRTPEGWVDAEGARVDAHDARQYGSMRSVGIATRG